MYVLRFYESASNSSPHLSSQSLFETVDGAGVQEALSRFGFGLSL